MCVCLAQHIGRALGGSQVRARTPPGPSWPKVSPSTRQGIGSIPGPSWPDIGRSRLLTSAPRPTSVPGQVLPTSIPAHQVRPGPPSTRPAAAPLPGAPPPPLRATGAEARALLKRRDLLRGLEGRLREAEAPLLRRPPAHMRARAAARGPTEPGALTLRQNRRGSSCEALCADPARLLTNKCRIDRFGAHPQISALLPRESRRRLRQLSSANLGSPPHRSHRHCAPVVAWAATPGRTRHGAPALRRATDTRGGESQKD